jgi:glycerol-3-phosphate dehydrogenase
MMAKMNVRGNSLMKKVCLDLDVPFKQNGAFVLSFSTDGRKGLEALLERGRSNGVTDMELLTGDQVRAIEPNVSDNVDSALLARTSGIVCPFTLTIGNAENAADNGVEFSFNTRVIGIEHENGLYKISTNHGDYISKTIVNCAGLYSDIIHNMVCKDQIKIIPRKGEYLLFDKKEGNLVDHTLFQLPTAFGKGVLVTPTIHGNLLAGPTAVDIESKDGTDTTKAGMDDVIKKASLSVRNFPRRSVITSFAGLRAHTNKTEFIIGENENGFYDAAGIESPGLSSAPAIGEYLSSLIIEKLHLSENKAFNPIRKGIVRADDLPDDERRELIESDPSYGQIICRCEMVSEGEILSAIHRTLGASTLDGIKRRTRAGMGRCQSGFCSPRVMDILSRELGLSLDEINKNRAGSYITSGKTDKGRIHK